MKFKATAGDTKIPIDMTPMIDIVFQLLAFFILTLKIGAAEGDFNIKMPLAAPSEGPSDQPFPPIRVRLAADSQGRLAGIQMGDRDLSSFDELHNEIIGLVGGDVPDELASQFEVEIDADYNLRYENVVQAITAISGYVSEVDGQRQIIKLIDKLKFTPPKQDEG
jgi:biopolymer transport protein ExbD